MKKSEIKPGQVYRSRRKGQYYSERRVERIGAHLARPKQKDKDCLMYIVTSGFHYGRTRRVTRASFARWAKEIVFERQMDLFDYLR